MKTREELNRQRQRILDLDRQGLTRKTIAERLGLTRTVVADVLAGRVRPEGRRNQDRSRKNFAGVPSIPEELAHTDKLTPMQQALANKAIDAAMARLTAMREKEPERQKPYEIPEISTFQARRSVSGAEY